MRILCNGSCTEKILDVVTRCCEFSLWVLLSLYAKFSLKKIILQNHIFTSTFDCVVWILQANPPKIIVVPLVSCAKIQ